MDNKVILLVEDNSRDEALTLRALKKSNIVNEVVVARDGVEALDYLFGTGAQAIRLCRERNEPIHLLLTDVVMPETSGKEIADCLTLLRPTTRVLFMLGYTDKAIVHHGVLDSNVEFIQKPFTPIALAKKVRHVLD